MTTRKRAKTFLPPKEVLLNVRKKRSSQTIASTAKNNKVNTTKMETKLNRKKTGMAKREILTKVTVTKNKTTMGKSNQKKAMTTKMETMMAKMEKTIEPSH